LQAVIPPTPEKPFTVPVLQDSNAQLPAHKPARKASITKPKAEEDFDATDFPSPAKVCDGRHNLRLALTLPAALEKDASSSFLLIGAFFDISTGICGLQAGGVEGVPLTSGRGS
jgi:hypothetical protein